MTDSSAAFATPIQSYAGHATVAPKSKPTIEPCSPFSSRSTNGATSAYSLKALVAPFAELLEKGEHGSIVGLDFDATVAWPAYDWMGVAKAALESVNRYLARDLGARGLRSNLVSAGPIKTIASGSIPGFEMLAGAWDAQAPLAWDPRDAGPVADACLFLLSGLARGVTGEILHVDGGYHALGAPLAPPDEPDEPDDVPAPSE